MNHLVLFQDKIFEEKLNIKTNEIANMLGVSYKSVITARYRLRKKLDAPAEMELIDFLNM